MATVVLCACGVANFPLGGGHFWVYMQYAQALRRLGCNVYWLERFHRTPDAQVDATRVATFFKRMHQFGLAGHAILYVAPTDGNIQNSPCEYIGASASAAEGLFAGADLLLNFEYRIEPSLLSRFRRTALVDIDPGLLQFWIETNQCPPQRHDLYFTTGENIASTCSDKTGIIPWVHVTRPIDLNLWPFAFDPDCRSFSTVSSWWGGHGRGEWVTDGRELCFENNKRVSFMRFVDLPRRVSQRLELALFLGEGDPVDSPFLESEWETSPVYPADITDYQGDAMDRHILEQHGWAVQLSQDVAPSPEAYQAYIQQSRGEFSCAKPSCMRFGNAWISDRTLCYLASGKPAVVQHTGPSAFLPDSEGLFRFRDMTEAIEALRAVDRDYRRQCDAARALAERYFDGRRVVERMLDTVWAGEQANRAGAASLRSSSTA